MKRRGLATRRIFWIVLVVGLVSAMLAEAVIPLSGRTMRAVASVNRASGRTKALQLEMSLRIGSEPPIASAELISHPSGLARIEIRGYDGRIDRYLLSGDELVGTRNGEPLFRPRPILQPYFLLQAGSESTLRTALQTFGVRTQSIGLAPCGDEDCFVIGDPGSRHRCPKSKSNPTRAHSKTLASIPRRSILDFVHRTRTSRQSSRSSADGYPGSGSTPRISRCEGSTARTESS